VGRHRLRADHELGGDLRLPQSRGKLLEHGELAPREAVLPRSRARPPQRRTTEESSNAGESSFGSTGLARKSSQPINNPAERSSASTLVPETRMIGSSAPHCSRSSRQISKPLIPGRQTSSMTSDGGSIRTGRRPSTPAVIGVYRARVLVRLFHEAVVAAPESPVETIMVTCSRCAACKTEFTRATSAGVKHCSPVPALSETTPPCVRPSLKAATTAALTLPRLATYGDGIRTSRMAASGASSCTTSVSPLPRWMPARATARARGCSLPAASRQVDRTGHRSASGPVGCRTPPARECRCPPAAILRKVGTPAGRPSVPGR